MTRFSLWNVRTDSPQVLDEDGRLVDVVPCDRRVVNGLNYMEVCAGGWVVILKAGPVKIRLRWRPFKSPKLMFGLYWRVGDTGQAGGSLGLQSPLVKV